MASHEDMKDYIKESEEIEIASEDVNLERSVDDLGA